jgi:hypothetical protein
MMSALMLLTLSAGTAAFAQGNSGGHANNGNGNGNSPVTAPAWGRWHLVPPGLGLGLAMGSLNLVPAADLPADLFALLPLPAGTDPLTTGGVTVRASGIVAVTLKGAVASQGYDVWFCHYSTLPNHCGLLGTAQTDVNGHVNTTFNFLAPGTAAAGVFAIARAGAVRYVSGFEAPPAAVQGTPIALEGTIAAITDSTQSFTLKNTSLVIMVDSTTDFTGVANLSALLVGDLVLIKGTLMPDGTVVATSVKLE